MKTSKLTHYIRLLRTNSFNHPLHWGISGFDYSQPTGGGEIACDREVLNNPILPFIWNRTDYSNFKLKSKYMIQYHNSQKIWINRANQILDQLLKK